MSDENGFSEQQSFKDVDQWLATQKPWERLWWSVVFLSDAFVDIPNLIQDKLFGKHNRVFSRFISIVFIIVVLVVIAKLLTS